MKNQCKRLTEAKCNELLKIITKNQRVDVKPICSISYPVPNLYEDMFKKEVERLVIIRFLEG